MEIEEFTNLYNKSATKYGWPKVKVLSSKRKKAIKQALKNVPEKSDWENIFLYLSKDKFWSGIMDFDKCYRNERYLEWLEKSEQVEKEDPFSALMLKQEARVNG